MIRFYILFLFLTIGFSGFAQSKERDYSSLSFMKVDSFYKKHQINLVTCNMPDLYFELFKKAVQSSHSVGKKKDINSLELISILYKKVYGKTISTASVATIFNRSDLVELKSLSEGDLVFFNVKGKYLSQMGIYLQHGKFAYINNHGEVMISDMEEPFYKKYFYKAARVNEQNIMYKTAEK